MAYIIELHEIAEEELWEAVDWYDSRRTRLGKEFARELQEIMQRVRDNPYQFPKVSKYRRQATLRRFPYAVIYEIQDTTILVIAIFHTKRNPKIWKDRLN